MVLLAALVILASAGKLDVPAPPAKVLTVPHQGPASEELARLLDRRGSLKAGPERERVDAEIRTKFEKTLGVMITDMSGMTELTKREGTIGILGVIREMQRLCVPVVEEHGGRWIKMEADDLFVVHASPKKLYAIARGLQVVVKKRNETATDAMKIAVGLGFGPVLDIGGEDIWGDAVNTASKLGEDTAEGGEIMITEDFYRALVADGEPAPECVALDASRGVRFAARSCK